MTPSREEALFALELPGVRGLPETVTVRGEVVVRERAYVGTPGSGPFLPRARFGG